MSNSVSSSTGGTGHDIVHNANTPWYTGGEQTSLLLCLLIHLILCRHRGYLSNECTVGTSAVERMKKKCGGHVMTLMLKVNKVIYCRCYCHDS
jgi:hypothetical protein